MAYHPGKFTWFEHICTEPARARTFYEGLFGWEVQPVPMGDNPYDMIHNAGQGIGGFYRAPEGVADHWISYLSVDDVDASFKAALAAGAKPVMAPVGFPGIGRGATIADPTGAMVSLWRGAQQDRDDVDRVPPGDWAWNELWSPDPDAALRFYESVFGYTHDTMDMGPAGRYHVIKDSNGRGRAGVVGAAQPGTPARWMGYVHVEDPDLTMARVAPLGGKLLMAPADVLGAGRIAMLQDPFGVPIGIIRPQPPAA